MFVHARVLAGSDTLDLPRAAEVTILPLDGSQQLIPAMGFRYEVSAD
jgi:hypothetical protein